MAADLDNVVHAPLDAEVVDDISGRGITGEVDIGYDIPVGIRVAIGVAVDGAHLRGPGMADDQEAAFLGADRAPIFIDHISLDGREWPGRAAGFRRNGERRCNHNCAGLRLPPGINDWTRTAADVLTIPDPGLRVDRLTNGAEQTQAAQIMFGRPLLAKAHQAANGGRRGVENGHFILFDEAPDAAGLRVGRRSFKHDACHAIHQRAVDDIAVPGYPAYVGRAPVDVVGLDVKNKLRGCVHANAIAAMHVYHTLWPASAAAGVEDIEDIFTIHLLAGHNRILRDVGDQVVQVDIASLLHIDVGAQPPDDECVFDGRGILQGFVGDLLEFDQLAAAIVGIGSNHNF